MKLGGTKMAGKAPAPMATGGWRKATALARATIVAGIALGGGLACDSGSTSTAADGQPPASSPPSQSPQAPASAGQAAGTTTKSQYLSSLDNVANSGIVFFGNVEVNGHHFRNSVVQVLDGQADSVSYDLGRKWRALDVTLGLISGSSGSGTVEFQVTADNRLIYTGDVAPGQSRHVRLDVASVARLDLTSTIQSNGGTTVNFVADWGNAKLLG